MNGIISELVYTNAIHLNEFAFLLLIPRLDTFLDNVFVSI